MSAHAKPVPPFDLVIFGATGDLAMRKLIPALFRRHADGQITDDSRILGVARKQQDTNAFREQAQQALLRSVGDDSALAANVAGFLGLLDYHMLDAVRLDATSDAGWDDLAAALGDANGRERVFYLSTSPSIFVELCERLRAHGLASDSARVVIEKPIGHDLESARAINDAVGHVFSEEQIFRIDHYLGKETVQNLLALRFANVLLEPLWNAAHIDHVQITVAEDIGVEKRGAYYDSAGALRDMVQNHLLQLLCMVAMEPPASLASDAVRDEKLKVLHALKPIDAENAAQSTVRGQYRAGAGNGGAVAGYLQDLDQADSRTETFVAIKAEVANWRWAGVPFYLRTGKRLPARMSEIVIQFRSLPYSIFAAGSGHIQPNKLVLRLQPDEGVKLWLMAKYPGPGGLRLQCVPLDMSFAKAFGVQQPDAYERLLLDVVRGNLTLFMRRDEVEAAWHWIDPIREAWDAGGETPRPYTAGTWGPSAAVALIERDGRTWHDDDSF